MDKEEECFSPLDMCKRGVDRTDVHNFVGIATLDIEHRLDFALDALLVSKTPQSTYIYVSILQACHKSKRLAQVRQVHAHIVSSGATLSGFLGDYLVMALAKCGAADEAQRLYLTLPYRTVIACTALMSAYVACGQPENVLKLYNIMQKDQMEPDSYTFVSLLKAYQFLQDVNSGRVVHIEVCKKGLTSVAHVHNSLIVMYGKCGALAEAEKIFCLQSSLNIVSWTVMLSVYLDRGQPGKAMWVYRQMLDEELKPDQFAFVSALQACSIIGNHGKITIENTLSPFISVRVVEALHADALRAGYACDVLVGTALLSAYGKCGSLSQVEYMFGVLMERNFVTWNAIMSAYLDEGQEVKALLLYRQMHETGEEPEQMTFVIAFQACGNLAGKSEAFLPSSATSRMLYLQILQALHADFCTSEHPDSVVAATALLISYAKCGAISEAEDIFDSVVCPDLVVWNAMLSSYVELELGEKVAFLYAHMQEERLAVDDVTVISALLGCGETGSAALCKHIHFGAVSASFDKCLAVIASLMHAYGNCSMIVDVQSCFNGISIPDTTAWNACMAHCAGEEGFARAFCMFESRKLADLNVDEIGFTLILTACVHTGLVAVGIELFESLTMDFDLTADVQHYSVLINLYARAGDFKRIANILEGNLVHGNINTWLILLGACQSHGKIELAKLFFEDALAMQPKQAVPYVLMSNIYAVVEQHAED